MTGRSRRELLQLAAAGSVVGVRDLVSINLGYERLRDMQGAEQVQNTAVAVDLRSARRL